MKRGHIRRLLASVRECNDQLNSFIQKAEKAESRGVQQQNAEAMRRKKRALRMPLEQVNNHAAHLYRVLSNAWACCAHNSHQVNLLLEHRMDRVERKRLLRLSESTEISFTLSLGHVGEAGPTWRIAEVKVLTEQLTEPT